MRLPSGGAPGAALGRPRAGCEARYFVKLDAWHALELPLLRRAFPDVPRVFLHRDPVEVMASHQRQTAAQMLPGIVPPERVGLDPASADLMSRDAYAAHLLAGICEAARRARDGRALCLDCRAVPEPALGAVLEHCGVRCGAEERRTVGGGTFSATLTAPGCGTAVVTAAVNGTGTTTA
jgi:hypothetical protein